ncbi:NUDIX domain-containing protein [Nocardia carnea]|uniref:NUDIX domain-containing protein n=1 Tax=Nocardia carnea TaxID=37328 RepID=UPI0024569CA6|nr:NUDIX domain-containing protein [Nocardia carnea]
MTSNRESARQLVRDLVAGIDVFDGTEEAAQQVALAWIDSEAPLFRVRPPKVPDPHLCVYAVLVDEHRRKVLLADHVKAGAWLSVGGHVDDGESPRAAVLREAHEELQITPRFLPRSGAEPFFLTVTRTRGADSHTDVSLWFLLSGEEGMELVRDPVEAHELRWFTIDDPAEWVDAQRFDPGMPRFLSKLITHLAEPATIA